MDWIVWDRSLETGDARLDADHRELAELLNRLRDAVESRAFSAVCARALEETIAHAQAHFELEQQLMTRLRYPKIDQHAAEHAMLIRQALDLKQRFSLDPAACLGELTQFPEVWLSFHILFSDKELAAFLASDKNGPGAS